MSLSTRRYTLSDPSMILSMNIHPTSGGVAPLYRPVKPSLRRVVRRQSRGPRNCVEVVVWSLTFTVSKGCPTIVCVSYERV